MTVKSIVFALVPHFLRKYTSRIEESPLGYRLAKGAFWSLAGAMISRGLGLLASIIVARMLGKVGFGELGIIQSTVGMFGVFAGFSMGLTSTKHVAEFKAKDPAKAGRIMALSSLVAIVSGGLMAIVLVIFAPWLATHTLAAPHLSGLLQITAVVLFLSALTGAQTGALSGFEAFKTIARVNLLSGFVTFPFMVGGVYLAGLQGAIWGLLASIGLNWLLNHLALKVEARKANVPFTYKNCLQEWNVVHSFSLPAVLASAIVEPINWFCYAMLVNQPNGYAEIGVYNAVLRVKIIPEMVLGMLISPLLPILSEQYSRKSISSYNKTIFYAFIISWLVVIPISLIQMIAPSLTLLPFGREFYGNHGIVKWLMLQAILNGLIVPITQIFASTNRMWFSFVSRLIWGISYLLFTYALVPTYGGIGLAAAFTFTHFIILIPYLFYLYYFEKSIVFDSQLFRLFSYTISLSVICFISSYFVSPFVAIVIVVIATCIFMYNILNRFRSNSIIQNQRKI